ncbi:hypothetical protein TFUB20_01917 [Tannerella forsythia]|uniref:Uncharacterized protein n=1 Tax=Tannerella forsythia TaxID=28112 RepID=A0A1D3USC8_TANFO|nr:hypothetical protein TFUB20_01917 [Tannerella forsythia]
MTLEYICIISLSKLLPYKAPAYNIGNLRKYNIFDRL